MALTAEEREELKNEFLSLIPKEALMLEKGKSGPSAWGKWKGRIALWFGLFIAAALALTFVVTHVMAILGMAGHFLGAAFLVVIFLAVILLVLFYGFDFMTQAREVNRRVDALDEFYKENPEERVSQADGLVFLAGGVQTAGIFICAGLVLYAVLSHMAELVVPGIQ